MQLHSRLIGGAAITFEPNHFAPSHFAPNRRGTVRGFSFLAYVSYPHIQLADFIGDLRQWGKWERYILAGLE